MTFVILNIDLIDEPISWVINCVVEYAGGGMIFYCI